MLSEEDIYHMICVANIDMESCLDQESTGQNVIELLGMFSDVFM